MPYLYLSLNYPNVRGFNFWQSYCSNCFKMDQEQFNKANQFLKQGRLEAAKQICKETRSHFPDDPDALNMLGALYLLEKKYEQSRDILKRLLMINPKHADGLNYLGLISLEQDRNFKIALSYFEKVIEIDAFHLNGLTNIGNTYLAMNKADLAEKYYQRAYQVNPLDGVILNNLGALSVLKNDRKKSMQYYRRALKCLPNDREILANLIIASNESGQRMEAINLSLKVVEMTDAGVALFPALYTINMACYWKETTVLLKKVFEEIRKGRLLVSAFENINLLLLTVQEVTHETLFETLKTSGKLIDSLRVRPPYEKHEKAMAPTRRWRIGYVSPDFRNHVVSTFFRSLINNHDKDRFEVYCYSNTKKEDYLTAQYRDTADHFINITRWSDAQLAEQIHSDGIHFLVDLAGFTQNGRLPVLSYKSAPVQLMYLGYPYTSGLSAVDYFITDRFLDGPKNADYFTEKQLRLPESFVSYGILGDQKIADEIPWKKNGFVTFGSLINTYKLSPAMIKVWSQILSHLPDAKLILNHPNYALKAVRGNILAEFSRQGIQKNRILICWKKHPDGYFLRYYNDIDIVLDSFPATGGTTTLDAVWMGLPVVTLVGEIYPERLSYSILSNMDVNLDDLIAFSEAEYLEKAIALAENPDRISEIRKLIPASLKQSIFCDPIRFTRQMEEAYISGWQLKFDDSPIVETLSEEIEYVLVGGAEIAVSGLPDDLNTYVLKEQQGWFDPEYSFVQKLIKPGMSLLDLYVDSGSYAIPLAQKVGEQGHVWAATQTMKAGGFLEKSKKRNGLNHLKIMSQGDKRIDLDAEMEIHSLAEIDFVRLNINTRETALLESGQSFFTQNSPVVMFGIRRDNAVVDTTFVSIFRALGYEIYRLIPGLDLLVPFSSEDELDVFAMNLFACKAAQVQRLLEEGLLISKIETLAELPGLEIQDWQAYLGEYPYAMPYIKNWRNATEKEADWEVYWVALHLFSWSKDLNRATSLRYAALQSAYGFLCLLAKNNPTLPRLFSLSRVMIEIGKREEAAYLLEQILSVFENGQVPKLEEPFIALSEEDALLDPGDHFVEWLKASVLKQWGKNRAFSSYFIGEDAIPIFDAIRKTGFCGPEIERQIHLLRARFSKQTQGTETLEHEKSVC